MSMRHRNYPDPEENHLLESPRNDERSGCLVTSSKERKGGRGPNVLMPPVPEKDTAVITPLNKDAWIMEPMKKNISSTITCLLKAHYPGVYRTLDQHGRQVPEKDAVVIAHYQNYPAITSKTILNDFWSAWIEKKWWGKLCDVWSDENVKKVLAQNSKNPKEGGGFHHTCG